MDVLHESLRIGFIAAVGIHTGLQDSATMLLMTEILSSSYTIRRVSMLDEWIYDPHKPLFNVNNNTLYRSTSVIILVLNSEICRLILVKKII